MQDAHVPVRLRPRKALCLCCKNIIQSEGLRENLCPRQRDQSQDYNKIKLLPARCQQKAREKVSSPTNHLLKFSTLLHVADSTCSVFDIHHSLVLGMVCNFAIKVHFTLQDFKSCLSLKQFEFSPLNCT